MNKGIKQTSWLIIGTALAVFSYIGTVAADDVEIFVAGEDPDDQGGVYPNIMFIIDTSGSMGTEVATQGTYDANQIYTGDCDSNYLYITTTGNAPNCATATRKLKRSLNFCVKAARRFDSGQLFFKNKMATWKEEPEDTANSWEALPQGELTSPLDCHADRKKNNNPVSDGEGLNDNRYPANGVSTAYKTALGNGNTPDKASFNNFDRVYLWSGHVMNWEQSVLVPKTRLETVQDVVVSMLDGLDGVNVGLMRFNSSEGGPVLIDIQDIEDNRDTMKTAVKGLTAGGWTPLSETFYEFGQYMYGKEVVYGDGYQHDSVKESRTGDDIDSTTYESPTEFLCQKNYVVYLTDGEPTQDTGANGTIASLISKGECANDHGNTNGMCLDDLAAYYAKTPVISIGGEDGQPIRTYTIGFTIDLPLLEDTAIAGNPNYNPGGETGYYKADNTAQLASTLTKITVGILEDSTTFTAPAVPVNSFNRTENLNSVYTSLFKPSASIHWPGNLKRYAFKDGKFVDKDDNPAIDEGTGFFSEGAWSYWSGEADGSIITAGGAASKMPEYNARTIVTDIDGPDLTVGNNVLYATNPSLTAETFGASTGTVTIDGTSRQWKEVMIQWLNGLDLRNANNNFVGGDTNQPIFTDTRRQYGDPLHARPVPILYGGTAESPDIVVYIVTNDGMLHAVDAATGEELWAYVPESVLDRMFGLYIDEVSAIKRYILDGQPVVHVINDDGNPGFNGPGEQAIMVFGMRRGGSSYFALDITDKDKPEKLWEIDNTSTGFTHMGQSWSEPQMGSVLFDTGLGLDKTPVMFIGGGYDTSQDTSAFSTDARGSAVYMVDLLTGEKLWSAGDENVAHDLELEMQHSIPAPPLVIDTNFDGLLDRIYVGDMGGRIWRMDLANGNPVATFGSGGKIATLGAADIGGTPAATDIRRFYNQIDLVEESYGEVRYFALNIGSGYRAHPLNKVIDEEFYSVRDFQPYKTNPTYGSAVTRADLIDITTNTVDIDLVSATSPGWKLRMDNGVGEKVLGKSLTINGVVYFTSFSPGGKANSCNADKGTNRLYAVSLGFGRPVQNLDVIDNKEDYDQTDFATDLKFGGLGSEVFLMTETRAIYDDYDNAIGEEVVASPCSSLVCTDDKIVLSPSRTYWTQEGM